MKKRTVIAIIITIICIIATNKFWLIFKPINVSFNIKGQGTPFIEVCLDKKKAGHKIDLIKKHRLSAS